MRHASDFASVSETPRRGAICDAQRSRSADRHGIFGPSAGATWWASHGTAVDGAYGHSREVDVLKATNVDGGHRIAFWIDTLAAGKDAADWAEATLDNVLIEGVGAGGSFGTKQAKVVAWHKPQRRVTQGSGTYVEAFAVDLALAKRPRHQQSMALAGLRGALRVIDSRKVRANAAQARALRLPARANLLCLQVLGEAEQQPLHFSERVFPLPRFAGLAEVVRTTGSITAGFAAHGVDDYTRHHSRITAQMPEPGVASCLHQAASRPVLFVESVNIDTAGLPIEFAKTWFAGDRVTLTLSHDE